MGSAAVIRIVTPETYPAFQRELHAMHRLRCRVFKERLGWDVEVRDGEERDRFDELDPVYILAFDDRDVLVGSWRLLPTTGPNMLRDVFPHLLGGRPIPENPLVWECSRFSVDCAESEDNSLTAVNKATQELFCGLIELCLARGIREVVTVYDIRIARLLPRIGCHPIWKTRPQRIGNTSALAGLFATDRAVLDRVRNSAGITQSVILGVDRIRGPRAA